MTNGELEISARAACMSAEMMLAASAGYTPEHSFVIMEGGQVVGAQNPLQAVDAASLNKLAIVHALEVSDFKPDAEMRLEPSDIRAGKGRMQYFPLGFAFSLGEAATMALSLSDNTATRAIVRRLGGPDEVNELLHSRSPLRTELAATALEPTTTHSTPDAPYTYGKTTAREAARLMWQLLENGTFAKALHQGEFTGGLRNDLGEELPAYPTPKLQRRLDAAALPSRIPVVRFPESVYRWLLRDLPPRTAFPNKQGEVDDLRHDVAGIGSYTVAVLSTDHQAYGRQGSRRIPDYMSYAAHRKIGSETLIAAAP